MNWHLPMHHFGWMLVGWEFFSLGDYLPTNHPKLAWLVYLMFCLLYLLLFIQRKFVHFLLHLSPINLLFTTTYQFPTLR